ncbi:uncharacterized protein SCODWIG_02703 [Saccharomycodes ludwigii]|uniref:Chromatin modification-related protein EAF6 n=1 Tax=Saccharomycodes ludwigii TaxID=36035 RepID=A0A376B8F0_9ASCO|nr:hypothetical protein SCDLUD_003762 [Saccharomycodes ludwigii]KAH3900757.1 hypothetical protein SCDLUD_003762 [Saccharomycodes ludwigii]SSD60942.1 uncharacterized protein SCODWIG_02703 [Saccharomycodes ludwigii]
MSDSIGNDTVNTNQTATDIAISNSPPPTNDNNITNHDNLDTPVKKTNKEYELLKNKIKSNLKEKQRLEIELEKLNQLIFDKETQYFKPTSILNQYGNIIKGFDNFSKHHHSSGSGVGSASSSNAANGNHNNNVIDDNDRIFSLSNGIYQNSSPGDADATNR